MTEGKLFSQAEERDFRQMDLPAQQEHLLEKYRYRNASVVPAGLVLAGDSLTEFLPDEKLQTSLPLYNRGIRGIGVAFLSKYLDTLVLDLKPTCLVLLIGTNDLMLGMKAEDLVDQIEELIRTVQESLPSCRLVLQSLYPRRHSMQWGDALKDDIEVVNLYLKNLSGITYLDMHGLLSDSDGFLKQDYTKDGVHLTMAGYRVVLERLAEELAL